jgi:hypothetical protein
MFKGKKFDYSNPDSFKTDADTVGNTDYWLKKIPGLSDEDYMLLQCLTRPEYDESDVEDVKNSVLMYRKKMNDKIIKEIADRSSVEWIDPAIENQEYIKSMEEYYNNPNIKISR